MTRLRLFALALPAVFVLHVVEEAPFFVAWFNDLVTPPITERMFLSVNATAFAITLAVALAVAASREPAAGLLGAAWVGFLMFANGLFHIVATVAHHRYCPGVLTGTLLYLPLSILFLRAASRELHIPGIVVAAVALAGGVPMYAHGYLIVFRGSRLF